jgi:hypothetical protein
VWDVELLYAARHGYGSAHELFIFKIGWLFCMFEHIRWRQKKTPLISSRHVANHPLSMPVLHAILHSHPALRVKLAIA